MHTLCFCLFITLVLGYVFYPVSLGKFWSPRPNGLKPQASTASLWEVCFAAGETLWYSPSPIFPEIEMTSVELLRHENVSEYFQHCQREVNCSVTRSGPNYHREYISSYHNVHLKMCCRIHRRKVWVTCAFCYFCLLFLLHSVLWGLDAL